MDKRGQFYLVAAVIIVLILSGLSGVSTFVDVKSEPATIKSISEDLARESYNIVEYGIYNDEDLDGLLTSFSGDYIGEFFLQKSPESNIIFLFGNKNGLKVLQYNKGSQGKISLGSANFKTKKNFVRVKEISSAELAGKDTIDLELLGNTYTFEIKDNEMFYFVVVKEGDEETFIELSDGAKDKGKKDKGKDG